MKPVSFKPWRKTPTQSAYEPGEVLPIYPITGTLGCCARAASGHTTAAPPRSVMNSRRLMASPAPRTKSGSKDYHIFGPRIVPFVAPKRDRNHVRFGSKADIEARPRHVRFTSESGHWNSLAACPLCANSVLMHCSKKLLGRLRLLCLRPHEPATLQALSRPDRVEIVELRNRL